jgi:hypothetical protein
MRANSEGSLHDEAEMRNLLTVNLSDMFAGHTTSSHARNPSYNYRIPLQQDH